MARIGANLNHIARGANTYKGDAEAIQIITHLVAIERDLGALIDTEKRVSGRSVRFCTLRP